MLIGISKLSVKKDFRIITNNNAADSKIGSSLKINFRADQTHESHSTAWESTTLWAFTIGSVFNFTWYLLVKLRRLVDQRRCRKQSFFSCILRPEHCVVNFIDFSSSHISLFYNIIWIFWNKSLQFLSKFIFSLFFGLICEKWFRVL